MSNAIFPTLIGRTWDITRVPRFATKTQQAVGGRELTASFQPYPIWRWTLHYEFLRTYTPPGGTAFTEWQQLCGFYEARQGAFDSFLYLDPEDYLIPASAPQLLGIGDGVNASFQLGRALSSTGLFEPIFNPIFSPAPILYLNGVVVPPGYSIDDTGAVQLAAPPAGGVVLSWSGQYYWRCRFDDDEVAFQMFASGFWKQSGLSFHSVLGS